jgi:hypothetical protein
MAQLTLEPTLAIFEKLEDEKDSIWRLYSSEVLSTENQSPEC